MIETLHNIANTILGVDNLKTFSQTMSLAILNSNQYNIIMTTKQSGSRVNPIKIDKNKSMYFNLSIGNYYLNIYNGNNKIYHEEIYVSQDMLGTADIRTI